MYAEKKEVLSHRYKKKKEQPSSPSSPPDL